MNAKRKVSPTQTIRARGKILTLLASVLIQFATDMKQIVSGVISDIFVPVHSVIFRDRLKSYGAIRLIVVGDIFVSFSR